MTQMVNVDPKQSSLCPGADMFMMAGLFIRLAKSMPPGSPGKPPPGAPPAPPAAGPPRDTGADSGSSAADVLGMRALAVLSDDCMTEFFERAEAL